MPHILGIYRIGYKSSLEILTIKLGKIGDSALYFRHSACRTSVLRRWASNGDVGGGEAEAAYV